MTYFGLSEESEQSPIVVTQYTRGPFVIVVVDPDDDDPVPQVVGPPGGFAKKEEAIGFIEKGWKNRKEPYLGLEFKIAPLRSLGSFIVFCSWEE